MQSLDDHLREKVRQCMGERSILGLAKAAGMNESTLRAWMAGTSRTITVESLGKVAEALGVELWKLFPHAPVMPDELARFLQAYRNASPEIREWAVRGMELQAHSRPGASQPPSAATRSSVVRAADD